MNAGDCKQYQRRRHVLYMYIDSFVSLLQGKKISIKQKRKSKAMGWRMNNPQPTIGIRINGVGTYSTK